MGRGINSCMNIAGWNHLFTPNSQAAQEARMNCVDYWLGRTAGGNVQKSANDSEDKVLFTPKNVLVVVLIVGLIIYLKR